MSKNHKIAVVILMTLVLVIGIFLGACAEKPQPTGPAPSPKPSPSPSPAPGQETYELTIQSLVPPGIFAFDVTLQQKWVDVMEKMSGGRLKINHVGAGAIVPNLEMHTATGKGVIDGTVTMSFYYGGTFPVAKFMYGYPGEFLNMRECLVLREMGIVDVLRDAYADQLNVHLIDVSVDHDLALFATEPINRLADIEGVKLRAGGAVGEVLGAAGASVTMMAGSEIYTALSTGVIESVVYGTISDAYSLGIPETAKYCVKDIHKPHFAADYMINKEKWDSLPEDLQEIIRVATEMNGLTGPIRPFIDNQELYQQFVAEGGTLIVWPQEDYDTMTDISLGLMEEQAATDPHSAQVLEMVKKIIAMR